MINCFKGFTRKRSNKKELLDLGGDYYSNEEYLNCQTILFKINNLLGIFSHTKSFLKKFAYPISILDIGCGGGLFILKLSEYFPDNYFTGTDISPDAIQMAKTEWCKSPSAKVNFELQTELKLNCSENSHDVLLATLVCHHIEDEELVLFFENTLKIARKAVLINDLHRHSIAYYFYKTFAPCFRNRLITHDGLISIRRGFKRKDWVHLLAQANITNYTLRWHFPFRWSLILWKN